MPERKEKTAAKERPAVSQKKQKHKPKIAKKPKAVKKRRTARKKKNALVLVKNPANSGGEFFIASELADDALIEQEIVGRALEHYVYSYTDAKGREVNGLSVHGVNETVRQLNRDPKSGSKVRISPAHIQINRDIEQDGKKGIEVIVYAEDLVNGGGDFGAKFEPYKKFSKKYNNTYENTFALEKALSKASRNAKRKLIPQKVALEMILKFKKAGKVKQIAAPPVKAVVVPAKKKTISKADLFAYTTKAIENEDNPEELKKMKAKIAVSPERLYSANQKQALINAIDGKIKTQSNPA